MKAANPELAGRFEQWRVQNQRRGWSLRWRRRSVWLAQLAQRLGLHLPVRVPLFFNERMKVVTGEEMSTGILAFGYTEVALTALMLRLLRAGDTMVDVGTHFGYEALLGSRLVGEQGSVLAFEPNPPAFAIAKANLARRRNVRLLPKAVGDRTGELRIERRSIVQSAFASVTASDGGDDGVTVPLTTVDAETLSDGRTVRFLKCDVEGAEEMVLRGAVGLLRRDTPILVLEADMPDERRGVSPRARLFEAFLAEFGYEAFDFDYDGGFRVAELGGLDVHHANVAFAAGDDRHILRSLAGT
jgi:FkbM family methyltransferase